MRDAWLLPCASSPSAMRGPCHHHTPDGHGPTVRLAWTYKRQHAATAATSAQYARLRAHSAVLRPGRPHAACPLPVLPCFSHHSLSLSSMRTRLTSMITCTLPARSAALRFAGRSLESASLAMIVSSTLPLRTPPSAVGVLLVKCDGLNVLLSASHPPFFGDSSCCLDPSRLNRSE